MRHGLLQCAGYERYYSTPPCTIGPNAHYRGSLSNHTLMDIPFYRRSRPCGRRFEHGVGPWKRICIPHGPAEWSRNARYICFPGQQRLVPSRIQNPGRKGCGLTLCEHQEQNRHAFRMNNSPNKVVERYARKLAPLTTDVGTINV